MLLTSVQNPRVKAAAHLRDRRQRDKQRRIIIDGAREIARAVAAGVVLVEAYVCRPLCRGSEAAALAETLPQTAAETFEVTEPVYGKLAFGDRGDGIVAVAVMPQRELTDLVLPKSALIAVLEGVEKPGNVGAVVRSADGAGLHAVILADPRTDLFNPNAIRASLGTVFTLPVCTATAPATLAWLRDQGMQMTAARVDGAVSYTTIDYRRPTAIILGSEAEGLTPLWSAGDIAAVRLPMCGAADSLNVSATAAVLFYEARRQRGA